MPRKKAMVQWELLTRAQLTYLANDIEDREHDREVDREQLQEEVGFDVVGASLAVAVHLKSEAKRRRP